MIYNNLVLLQSDRNTKSVEMAVS